MGPFWNVSLQGELRVGRIEAAYRRGLSRCQGAGLRDSGIYAGYSEGGLARSEGPAASMAPGAKGVCGSSSPRFSRGADHHGLKALSLTMIDHSLHCPIW
jgi:hypothetical protein